MTVLDEFRKNHHRALAYCLSILRANSRLSRGKTGIRPSGRSPTACFPNRALAAIRRSGDLLDAVEAIALQLSRFDGTITAFSD